MKKNLFLLMFVLLVGSAVFSSVPERVGWWKFDDPMDMLAATVGNPLTLTGSQTSVNGPVDGNLATEIGIGSHLIMTHGISPNGGGSLVNEYSMQMDILMPTPSLWHAIYQTASDNSNDAEMFINTDNFIGAWRFGYSANAVADNTWYRMIVTAKNGEFFRIYMNGELWVDGAGQDLDGRDALSDLLLLFADEDGEDNPMLCSEIGIWNVALTADEALELGDATTGAPSPTFPQRKGQWKFDDPMDMLAATVGSPLTLTGSQTSVNGPVDGNLATEIGVGSHLVMTHNISPNGGGTLVNEYSLQMDILMPAASLWHAIYQTSTDNSNDAEMFINTDNLIGAWRFGYSANVVAENTWYRMIVTAKNGEFFKIYMNGELWVDGTGQDLDGRDALDATFLLFADEDGEDNTMLCSEVAIWDVVLTAEEVASLGDATTSTGIVKHELKQTALLGQNYPNPAAVNTTFPYQVTESGNVGIRIADLSGRVVRSEQLGYHPVGSYTYKVNVENLPAGVYTVNLIMNQNMSVKRMMITR